MTDPMDYHALADGELGQAEANRLRLALDADPRANAEVSAILNLKDVLANNSLRHADEEAWRGCLRRLDEIDKTRRVEGFVGRYAWALCGLMFVFILSGRFAMRNLGYESASASDFAGVLSRSVRPTSREALLQQKAYRELLRAVGASLNPAEIQIGPIATGYLRDLRVAQYPLRDRKGDVVLTQVEGRLNIQDTEPLPSNPELSAGVANGNNLLVWHTNGQTYLLYGDRSLSDLGDFASRVLGAR